MCSIVSLYYENFWWVETWNVTFINGIANSCLYFRATHDLKKPYSLRQNGPLLKRFQYKKSRKSGISITESWYHIFERHKMSNTKLCALFCHMDIAGVSNTAWSIKKLFVIFIGKLSQQNFMSILCAIFMVTCSFGSTWNTKSWHFVPILHSLFVLFEYNLCPSMQDKNSKSSCYAFFVIPVHQKASIEILWINLCSLLFQCLFPCAIHLTLRRVEPDTFLHIRYTYNSLNQRKEVFKTKLEIGI